MALPTLTHVDLNSIETFAAAVQKKTAYGRIPQKLAVGEIEVPVRAVAPKTTTLTPLGDEDLRALYSPTNKDIQVYCSGVEIARGARACDHIVCVVGHEALHAIQHSHFSKDQIEEASALSKKADESPDAYGAYITCAVELPAHSVMIALELRQTDPSDFEEAALNTSIYRYFAAKLNGASVMDEALKQLVATALKMHPKLRPPKSETGSV